MRVVRSIAGLRSARAELAAPVGFVPTMGALHAGHGSLIARARAECASVVASVYVNPLQFGPGEDLALYPRSLDADSAMLERLGTDVLFAPTDDVMYPSGTQTAVDPGPLARILEGERRPGHFRGVATVVLKLLNLVDPQRAYFGQKDAQQLAIVQQMTADFELPVQIVGCPIVREADGLALSSRNAYLTTEQRRDAARLSQALHAVASALVAGEVDIAPLIAAATEILAPLRPDYIAVVDRREFIPLITAAAARDLLVAGAAYCGTTRLIDNVGVRTP
ncbi:MAG TPA: pantoate--beta-alanine ligase [Candidatus Eremiobacteraceae bacterium]|nr:pantoate--beta-alanine ligase [Candidatus Eremiobacteraceae bacterium]